jgi:hypothetical protein
VRRKCGGVAVTAAVRKHRRGQRRARMAAGEAWQDNDLVFCRDDGTPWKPGHVTRRFKVIAAAAGLPVIKLHEGRHSAASLARMPRWTRRFAARALVTRTRP